MNINKRTPLILFCFFLAVGSLGTAQEIIGNLAETPTSIETKGVFFRISFVLENGNEPDRLRDYGRYRSYEEEFALWEWLGHCGYGFLFNTGGAARFDDNDYAEFGIRGSCQIPHSRFSIVVDDFNLAPLASAGAPDPRARRLNSYPNVLWGGIDFHLKPNILLGYYRTIRGDFPLFSPYANSLPYVRQVARGEFALHVRHFELKDQAEFFMDNAPHVQAINRVTLEYPLLSRFWFGIEDQWSHNFGTPRAMPNPRFFGLRFEWRRPNPSTETNNTASDTTRRPSVATAIKTEVPTPAAPIKLNLSREEADILAEILAGKSPKEIAKKLGISQKKITAIRFALITKLGIRQ